MSEHDSPGLPRLMFKASEIAEMTGLSVPKVYALMSSGELPSVKVGTAVRVRNEDLRQWLDELEAERRQRFGIRRIPAKREVA